jgi:chromosome segregation ATPase
MNRTLTWLNLAGVAALAGLCALQWRANRALNLEINGLQRASLVQSGRLAEQERQLRDLASDLEGFRAQLGRAHAQLRETAEKRRTAEAEAARLTVERDGLKESLAAWTEAVRVRDERIAEANARIRETGERLRDAVEKFNELAARHRERTEQFNELAARYNALARQAEEAGGAAPAKPASS